MSVAGRPSAGDFSTRRKPSPASGRTPDETPSPALLFVSGRVPVHLRAATYATFDGESWRREAPPKERALHATEADGRTWVGPEPSRAWSDLYRETDAHALKVANLSGPELPCPPGTTGIHIADVTRPDLFALAAPDVIRLDRSTVPPLTVVHAASRRFDPAAADDPLLFGTLPTGCTEAPEELEAPLSERAAAWAAGREPGWDEVTAIRDRLRSDYALDLDAGDPETGSPTLHFLHEAKRGRAYQFATACCLLLRCRGYGARLVGGFYADAENYDRTLGHTVVSKEDVHVWCEVAVAPGVWATVDPSPGYEPLGPPPTWRDRVAGVFAAAGRFVVGNPAASAACLLAACGAIVVRRRLADGADVLGWRLARLWRDERDAVVAAVRVLDRRCRRAGAPRPPGRSPSRHFASLPAVAGFAEAAGRALFAPALHAEDAALAAAAVSRRVRCAD
ncbi:transglutaminase-like domain-containing protein, partial [Alienimonas sp. DA493]|uniref:transglutaminase-like domain-containing protein n=1 Tax=Alienimonas sp. DA493 TaxID=3373605 RepID=UPI0037546F3C